MLELCSKRYKDIQMESAVIVSTTRSPIGRAFKGSMIGVRPDDLMAFYIRDVMDKIHLDPDSIDDIIIGCGLPLYLQV